MSYQIQYNNIQFNVYDYTGTASLSTYTLDITPLNFVPDFTTSSLLSSAQSISNKIITWDFGDGSYANTLTASHVYKWPGNYKITLTIVDGNGDAYDSSYNPTIQVHDFVPTSLAWQSFTNNALSAKIMGPFRINALNSWQSYPELSASGYTINFYASGAGGSYIAATDFYNNKWSHLQTLNQFFAIENLFNNNQFVAVDSLSTIQTPIYANVSNNNLKICGPGDQGATIVGTSGYCDIYYSDDSVLDILNNSPIYLFATIDSSKFYDFYTQRTGLYNYVEYPAIGYQNLNPTVLAIQRNSTYYTPATALAVSTTGITGEGPFASTIFNIPTTCWQGIKVPYIVTLKDSNFYTTKFYPPLSSSIANSNVSQSAITNNLKTGIIYYDSNGVKQSLQGVTFVEDFVSPGAVQQLGSFYKGYFSSLNTALSCALTASLVVIDPLSGTMVTLTGTSNTFNIYTTAGKYNVAKINEDWDASGFYKSLRYQEPLLEYDNFFTNFLGTIVGDANAYPYELGKTVYEKITNFTSNKSDIESCNTDTLLSFCNELSIQFEQYNYSYPPQLRRITDLLSIKQQKLFGTQNTYNINFDNNNNLYTDRSIGPNLSSFNNIAYEISPLSGTITAGVPIVAYEKFSGNYTLVNNISSYYLSAAYTPLSTYNSNWGWGLLVPSGTTGSALSNYYRFYRYNNVRDGKIYDNIINWADSYTTVLTSQNSYSIWSQDDGIMQTMINYELTKGLNLFTSAVEIALT